VKTAILKALDRAREEANLGNNVMILLPNTNWVEPYKQAHSIMNRHRECGNYLYMPHPNVYVRYTHAHSSLRALLVDVLILVGEDSPGWCWRGLQLAQDRMRASTVQRTINI